MRKIRFAAFLFALLAAWQVGAFAAAAPDTLGRIRADKTIRVAYSPDSLPFSYTETNGEPSGYSIDLCKRVIAQVGRAVGVPDLKVKWIAASTPERLRRVAKGEADLDCANTTQTLARMADVDFSSLIFLETGGFIGRAGSNLTLGDMGGRKIAVLKGTTTETRLREALQKRLVNAQVVTIDRAADGIAMLESGGADLYAGDLIKLIGLISQSADPAKFEVLRERLSYEPYAFALPRNDSAFRLEVNRALSQVYRGGEIGPIYGRWLGVLGKPSDALGAMYLLYSIPD
ncbi:MAG TPA: amino acid ABC transporter substrate-binding protein [Usitatibacter sp.]|nr:amino acid ABC transporter substrate-binding protein [Usitatibacter sp.]